MSERNEFRIDPARFVEECFEHSEAVHAHHVKLVDAELAYDEAEDALEVVKAEMDREVRLHPSRHGLGEFAKLTEKMIEGAVLLSQAYRAANLEVIHARHEVKMLKAGAVSLEHKKRMFEKLTDLGLADFFAIPRIKGEVKARIREDVLGGPKKRAATTSRS